MNHPGFAINPSREQMHRLTSLYPWERKPTSRKQRMKLRRWQAFAWNQEMKMRANPIISREFGVKDKDTGIPLDITTYANGDRHVSISSPSYVIACDPRAPIILTTD